MKRKEVRAILMVMAVLSATGSRCVVKAAESDNVEFINGVQSSKDGIDYQQYRTTEDKENNRITGRWEDSPNEAETAQDYFSDGEVHLSYNTEDGTWTDPSGETHDNGTYIVTIPTKIAYKDMKIGRFNINDNYTVNVRGVLAENQAVTLMAETEKYLTYGHWTTDILENTTQGKTKWNPDETYGEQDKDGYITGTDCTDNIRISGEAKASGEYVGSVKYSAKLVNTETNQEVTKKVREGKN